MATENDKSNSATTRRTMLMSSALGALAAIASVGTAEAAESSTEQEQAATKVVTDFIGAWPSRDVEKIASYVGDDMVFKGAPNAMETKGKQAFISEISRFVNGPMGKNLNFAQRPSRVYAVGGQEGTAVLARRVDSINQNGRRMAVPLAAAFWVSDGKIQAWYDFPLVNLQPPGGGGGGAGGGPNQGPPGGQ